MKQVEETYISLLTDFGFKRIFGTAMNKNLLICFLNSFFMADRFEGRVVSESRARRRQVRWHIVISKTLLIRRSKKIRMRKPWKLPRTCLPMELTSI